jgi:hypothetical protein
MPVTKLYSHTFNDLLYSRSRGITCQVTQVSKSPNDPSPIFGHFGFRRRQPRGPTENLRASASNRLSRRTHLCRSQCCTLIHSTTYSTRDPSCITRREPRYSRFQTTPVPFSNTSPRLYADHRSAQNRASPRKSDLQRASFTLPGPKRPLFPRDAGTQKPFAQSNGKFSSASPRVKRRKAAHKTLLTLPPAAQAR